VENNHQKDQTLHKTVRGKFGSSITKPACIQFVLKGDYTAPSKLLYKTAKEQTNRGCTPASARRYAQAAMEQEKQVNNNL